MGQLLALAARWFPARPTDVETLGTALWLERDYWRKMEVAVANGIARAFTR